MRPEVAAREEGTIPSLDEWLPDLGVLASLRQQGCAASPALGDRPVHTLGGGRPLQDGLQEAFCSYDHLSPFSHRKGKGQMNMYRCLPPARAALHASQTLLPTSPLSEMSKPRCRERKVNGPRSADSGSGAARDLLPFPGPAPSGPHPLASGHYS